MATVVAVVSASGAIKEIKSMWKGSGADASEENWRGQCTVRRAHGKVVFAINTNKDEFPKRPQTKCVYLFAISRRFVRECQTWHGYCWHAKLCVPWCRHRRRRRCCWALFEMWITSARDAAMTMPRNILKTKWSQSGSAAVVAAEKELHKICLFLIKRAILYSWDNYSYNPIHSLTPSAARQQQTEIPCIIPRAHSLHSTAAPMLAQHTLLAPR